MTNDENQLDRTEALRRMLESIGSAYNDGDQVGVQWSEEGSAAHTDGRTVDIDPDGGNLLSKLDGLNGPARLAVIANTLSHEVEHLRESDLDGKGDFAQSHPEASTVAGAVINTLEDQYVDTSRTTRWRGLRGTQSWVVNTAMEHDGVRPPVNQLPNVTSQLVEGLVQVSFSGNAKGMDGVDDRVKQFLGWARGKAEEVRHVDDPDERKNISEEVFQALRAVAEEVDEFDPSAGGEYVRENVPNGERIDEEAQGGSPGGPEGEPEDGEFDGPPDGESLEEWLDTDDGQRGQGGGEPTEFDISELDSDAVADAVEAMESSDEMDSADWWGVGSDEEFDLDEFERRYQRLQELERLDDTDMGKRVREREIFTEAYQAMKGQGGRDPLMDDLGYHDHATVEEEIRRRDLDREIEEAFRRFTTADDHVAAYEGMRVNMPAAVEYASGNFGREDLFLTAKPIEHGDRVVGVTLDTSGSMDESMLEAKVALGAFYLATREIGDTFIATQFYLDRDPLPSKHVPDGYEYLTDSDGQPHADLIVGPGEEFEWRHLDSAAHGGFTPTSYAMADMRDLMDDTPAREKLMVVITDGRPSHVMGIAHPSYDEENGPKKDQNAGIEESATYAQALREAGYTLIGVAVDNHVQESTMDKIFGDGGWVRSDTGDLAETLVGVYRRALNQRAA